MKEAPEYNWSDAWLLLAVIYAGPEGATLERIIEVGNGIEHAIFNPDELESGLARLTTGGHVHDKAGVFYATSPVMTAHQKTTSPQRSIEKELSDIEKYLGAASLADPQPHSNNLRYPGFTKEAYTEAVNNYLARHRR